MKRLLLIAFGGAFGCVLRYLVSTSIYRVFGKDFPYGTLAVNALGSLLAGFLFILLLEYVDSVADSMRSLLIIGFLGGFTTFSSFSLETINLIENGEMSHACLNVVMSVVICLCLTWIGILLGRQL